MSLWFVSRSGGREAVRQYAQAWGIDYRQCSSLSEVRHDSGRRPIVMIDGPLFARSREHDALLLALVRDGGTLYIRGPSHPDAATLQLRPFLADGLRLAAHARGAVYSVGASPLLPAPLRLERWMVGGESPAVEVPARGLEGDARGLEVLTAVTHVDHVERASIVALRSGDGLVIYDACAEWPDPSEPLIARLANPETRALELGIIIALGRDPGAAAAQSAFDLVVDDRPANHDYFGTHAIRRFLSRVRDDYPGAHTDFAWTPGFTRPHRSYIEAIKRCRGGFVWHGFLKHVDHTRLSRPERDLEKGHRLVARLEHDYGVRFQRVMIYPFERSTAEQRRMLRRHGFTAIVQEPEFEDACAEPSAGAADALSHRFETNQDLLVAYRYPASSLTRDRMLAMAALRLPIIAYVHPDEVGLRRLPFQSRNYLNSYVGDVLKFAREKRLPSRSLETIVAALRGGPGALQDAAP